MISTPIKIIRYYSTGESKVTDLIESDIIHNELLTESFCRFNEKPAIDMIELLDSNIDHNADLLRLTNSIKSILVYQRLDSNSESPSKSVYDYYYYVNGTKVISVVLEPTVNKVGFVFNEQMPDYEISLDDDLSDLCYRLLIVSLTNDSEFNVVTEIHKSSNRPHISYFNDIMTDNNMNNICNNYMYYGEVRDIRSNTLIGKNLSMKLW